MLGWGNKLLSWLQNEQHLQLPCIRICKFKLNRKKPDGIVILKEILQEYLLIMESCPFFHFWDIKLWSYKEKHKKTWGRERGSVCTYCKPLYVHMYLNILYDWSQHWSRIGKPGYIFIQFALYAFINSWVDMSNVIHDEMDNQHAYASGPSELWGNYSPPFWPE